MKQLRYVSFGLLVAMVSCDDMHDVEPTITAGEEPILVLCEGLYNMNNSTLACIGSTVDADIFTTANSRGLGDTANDMLLYGSKLYIVVNVSSTIEIIDAQTMLSEAQISMFDDSGVARQPRYATACDGAVFVCSFDGTVARIDTATYELTDICSAGANPDGICAVGNRLFVSNSGGLDAPNYGTTVSVIDIATMTQVAEIEVGMNPGRIAADAENRIWVVARGNYDDVEPHITIIDADALTITEIIDLPVLNFNLTDDCAYAYAFDYSTNTSTYYTIDMNLEAQYFDIDYEIETPYAISVSPTTGNVFIADAHNYTESADIVCVNSSGIQQYTIDNVGLNPNTILFGDFTVDLQSESNTSDALPSEVVEYCPAPGQFINTAISCYADGYTNDEVLVKAFSRLQSGLLISLGGYGGYITVRFDEPIVNVSGECDIHVDGNAFSSSSGSSAEPGIVCVSVDVNGNGLPDDEWYELKGSAHDEATSGYTITYYNGDEIEWIDNQGNSGTIAANPYHTQDYFPLWLDTDELTFSGTLLPDVAAYNSETAQWEYTPFEFGYADNQPNTSSASDMNIDWAIDADGNPVELSSVDFVKIYTAVNQQCGILGEVSTEVAGIYNIHNQ